MVYEVPTTSFLPTVAIARLDDDFKLFDFNNLDDWLIQFTMNWSNGTYIELPSINCSDLINSWTSITEEEKAEFINELAFKNQMLCPNTTSFFVEGTDYGEANLDVIIISNPDISESALINSVVLTSDITRYFNPQHYSESGHQGAIALDPDVYFMINGTVAEKAKYIEQTDIHFYSFEWLDTSAFSAFDLSQTFVNYKVEKTKDRTRGYSAGSDYTGLQIRYF